VSIRATVAGIIRVALSIGAFDVGGIHRGVAQRTGRNVVVVGGAATSGK
jgi:hypothetical protein